MADDLMRNYHHIIDTLTITTGSGGVFDVHANDQVLFSKRLSMRHANPGEVLAAFQALIGPDVLTYEQAKQAVDR